MNITTLNTTILDGGVIIKKGGGGTPTPPSGGESASTIEYFVNDESHIATTMLMFAHYIKYVALEGEMRYALPVTISLKEDIDKMGGKIKEFGINLNERILSYEFGSIYESTVLELLETYGITRADIDTLPRITKEEFYSLD